MFIFTDNIALNKSAYQQNPFFVWDHKISDDTFEASNAVDGLKSDLSALGGQCAISMNKKTTATLWVNLSEVFSIHHITIYHRTDNNIWGIICFLASLWFKANLF